MDVLLSELLKVLTKPRQLASIDLPGQDNVLEEVKLVCVSDLVEGLLGQVEQLVSSDDSLSKQVEALQHAKVVAFIVEALSKAFEEGKFVLAEASHGAVIMSVDLSLELGIGRVEVVDLGEGPSICGRRLGRHTGLDFHDLLRKLLLVLDLFGGLGHRIDQAGSISDVRLIVLGSA